jgi:hypothetical protein
MVFDFAPGELDNVMYAAKIEAMSEAEMVEEYKGLLESWRRGGDRDYNLQGCFDIITAVAGRKGISLLKAINATKNESTKPIGPAGVDMIPTPSSKSIAEYGYDYIEKILYVKYKSGGDHYTFRISEDEFKKIQQAKSKGTAIGEMRRNYRSGKKVIQETKHGRKK